MQVRFLQDLIGSVVAHGRGLMDMARKPALRVINADTFSADARALLSQKGEASGVGMARELMANYAASSADARIDMLRRLASDFAPQRSDIRSAYEAYDRTPSERSLRALIQAVEPPRQELVRRLNLAPGNTLRLVRMREDLLDNLAADPAFPGLDDDFRHLFQSWFNRGFLVLRRIDWSTPANILEKVIQYEAVHAIESWDDLRGRLEPPDRRCFAFFHPALLDEPLIFVEVALATGIPDAIQPILTQNRRMLAPDEATTAVFYSISNCQRGLGGISFGNFLIKQVVEELRRELPSLQTFVTLSPVPGFGSWLTAQRASPGLTLPAALARLDGVDLASDEPARSELRGPLQELAAHYLLHARTPRGRPIDPVARFHLGNGARLERVNAFADTSAKGLRESHGVMVNYLYDLAAIEQNHEAFAETGAVAASSNVRRLAGRLEPLRQARDAAS
jgi:malonyl-CoA decarboxylase